MKTLFDTKKLPLLTLILGGVGMLLRFWLYGTGMDEAGLLVTTHPAGYLTLLLTVVMIVLTILLTRSISGQRKYSKIFPASSLGCGGAVAGAVCLALVATADLIHRTSMLSAIISILGIIAAVALAFTGYCRQLGRRPGFLYHSVLCLYFVLRLIDRYRVWSARPQLHDYCFQLLAAVCIMLYSYHRAALDVRPGSRRRLASFGLLGTYFCCLSVVHSDSVIFYVGMAAWLVTNVGTLKSAAPAPREGA